MSYPKKHSWENVRLRIGPNYIEAREHKPGEFFAFLALTLGPVVGYAWFYFATLGSVDDFGRVLVAVILAIPVLATLILFRPPRVLRLYPEEKLAQTGRTLLSRTLFVKWHDLGDAGVRIDRTEVVFAEESSGGIPAGCLLSLLGPLGMVIALFVSNSRKTERRKAAYALVQANRPTRPFALFLSKADPNKIVTLYDDATKN